METTIKQSEMEIADKQSEMQVIGCLMKNPFLLAEIDKYHFDVRDFSSKLTRYIFSAINNLFLDGAKQIGVIDIENYLSVYIDLKKDFDNFNGFVYLQDCESLSNEENFNYYYNRLKKFSALRALNADGFDISAFYSDDPMDKNYFKIMEKFDEVKVSDIFEEVKKKLFSIADNYTIGNNGESGPAADGLRDLKNQLKKAPELGSPLQGRYFNTVVRGARKGKYYIRSAGSGLGKTRMAVGDACNLAFPMYYDWKSNCWCRKEHCEKVLFITTELDKEEIQTLILSWVSGVNEEKILLGTYSFAEEAIVDEAIDLIDKYSENFIVEQISDPSIAKIESSIRKQVLTKNIQNIFYDYIFSSPSLLGEFAALKLREDVILMMLSTALKDLAVELKIFLATATQITGDPSEEKGIRGVKYIRGAKSVADKGDASYISCLVTEEEKKIIEPTIINLGLPMPNTVTDVWKCRRGKHKNVRIWSLVDLGTCRVVDVLITDAYYNVIPNFEVIEYSDDYRFKKDNSIQAENSSMKENSVVQEVLKRAPEPEKMPEQIEEVNKNKTLKDLRGLF